jgi:hypothetical protein
MPHEITLAAITRIRAQAAAAEQTRQAELGQYSTFEQYADHVSLICSLLKTQEVKHAMGVFGAEIYLELNGQKLLVLATSLIHDINKGKVQALGYKLPTPEEIDRELERIASRPFSNPILASSHISDAKASTQTRQPGGNWSTE